MRLSREKGGEPDRLGGTPSTWEHRLRRPTGPNFEEFGDQYEMLEYITDTMGLLINRLDHAMEVCDELAGEKHVNIKHPAA